MVLGAERRTSKAEYLYIGSSIPNGKIVTFLCLETENKIVVLYRSEICKIFRMEGERMTEKIVYQFDAYCKRTLQNEKVDYYRQKQYRMNHEVFLSDLEEGLLEKYFVINDTYMFGDTFTVSGHEIKVYDECLAEALHRLPEKKRTVILMSFYLGMSDAKIGRILGRAGSSIHTRRVSALSMLRKLMEEM